MPHRVADVKVFKSESEVAVVVSWVVKYVSFH